MGAGVKLILEALVYDDASARFFGGRSSSRSSATAHTSSVGPNTQASSIS
jgi:hypothetical protein